MSDRPVLPMPTFDGLSAPAAAPSSTTPALSTSTPAAAPSSTTPATSTSTEPPPPPRSSPALWAGFSPEVQAKVARFVRAKRLKVIDVIDAVAAAEGARELDGMAALNAALDVDAHDWPLSLLAQVDNLHGNLLAPTDPAASLARHERALLRYSAQPGFDNDTAYTLAQCVRRLVALARVDDAAALLDRLHTLPVATNAWVRNRLFEATLLIAHAVLTADAPRALRLAERALAVPLHGANAYTYEAHVDLWCIAANAHRLVGALDAGLAACARVRDDVLARAPRDRNTNYQGIAAWGMCEGAYLARRLDRPHDALSFLAALPHLGPLKPARASYAAVLRAWALMNVGDLNGTTQALDEARAHPTLTPPVASALTITLAERAALEGDRARARALAEDVLAHFNEEDDRARAGALLTRLG